METTELYWLAGLLEGEGCFALTGKAKYRYPSITLKMTDEDVIIRAAKLMGGGAIWKLTPKISNHKASFQIRIIGLRAATLMESLLPLMFKRRRAKISEILASNDTRLTKRHYRMVTAAELRSGGKKYTEIGHVLGCSHSTAIRLCRRFSSRKTTHYLDTTG